jgi:hypothetical protein
MSSQRTESNQSKSRHSPPEERLGAVLPQKPHDTPAAHYTTTKKERIAEEDCLEEIEDISKISPLELQKKYRQLERRLIRTDIQCSDLVEEITGLRAKNLVDDDSVLRDNFQTLDFSVRSWCIRLREHKLVNNESMSLTYPFSVEKASYSFKAAGDELHFLKSGLWAWLIKLVFDGATDMQNDDPDLWAEELSSIAMRYLERLFLTEGESFENNMQYFRLTLLDPRGAQEWRCLTVRMIAQCHAQTDMKRTRRLVRKIVNWATEGIGITKDKSQLEDLTNRLASEVVDRAVKLSLDLRRQYRTCRVLFPGELCLQFAPGKEITALPAASANSKPGQNMSEPGTIRIFSKPCLEKREWLHSASIDQDSVVLVDHEVVEFPVNRTVFSTDRGTSAVGKLVPSQDRHPKKCPVM